MDYSHYTVEDFVTDEFFIQWVKNPSEETNAFWNAWLSKYPAQANDIQEARNIIVSLQFKEERIPEDKFLELWENITTNLDNENFIKVTHTNEEEPEAAPVSIAFWVKIAASFLVMMAVVIYFIAHQQETSVVIKTAFGESRTLFLPDSTKVTLNANSTLRYDPATIERSREVWLDGEAFFSVVHKRNNQNFLVHTSELQVEVLGTKFNVNSRRGKSQVVLEEGKVKLDIDKDIKKSELIMQPGELVEVVRETKQVNKREVEVSNYSSWRNNLLVFVSASLEEIAKSLEDNYGYDVIFKEDELKSKRFTGSTAMDNPLELVEKLNKVFDLDIQQDGKKLIIQQNVLVAE